MRILGSRFQYPYRIRIILGTLFAVIVADGLITVFLVHNGIAQEANPFLSYWVRRDGFLALKITGGFLVTVYLFLMYRRRPVASIWVSTLSLAAYTLILFWNLLILG